MVSTENFIKSIIAIFLISNKNICNGLEEETFVLSGNKPEKHQFSKPAEFSDRDIPKVDIYKTQPQEVVQLNVSFLEENLGNNNFQKNYLNHEILNRVSDYIDYSLSEKSDLFYDDIDMFFEPEDNYYGDDDDNFVNSNLRTDISKDIFVNKPIEFSSEPKDTISTKIEEKEKNDNLEEIVKKVLDQISFNPITAPGPQLFDIKTVYSSKVVTNTVNVTQTVYTTDFSEFEYEFIEENIQTMPNITELQNTSSTKYFSNINATTSLFKMNKSTSLLSPTITRSKVPLVLHTTPAEKQNVSDDINETNLIKNDFDLQKDNQNILTYNSNNNLESMLSTTNNNFLTKPNSNKLSGLFKGLKQFFKSDTSSNNNGHYSNTNNKFEKIDKKNQKDFSTYFGKRSIEEEEIENLESFDLINKEIKYTSNNKALLSYNNYNSMMGAVIAIVMLTIFI
ncbi:hypothetical protein ACO0SA_002276 [Hanseniaspora valbyensis]